MVELVVGRVRVCTTNIQLWCRKAVNFSPLKMWAPPRRSASGSGSGSGGGGSTTTPSAGSGGNACGAPPAPPVPPVPPSPLHVLLQMGFPRHRAVKALAATGNKSVQLASDWLLTHVSDTTIDEDIPREYILYACPTGPLYDQLQEFWIKSKESFGWNGAHNYLPHITLVSFFKAPDECSLQLSKVLKHVIETVGQPPEDFLKLDMYTSPNFMGLFVSEEHAEYLKNVAVQYVKQVSSSIGLTVDTYEQLDALATCFPWCAVPQEPPQPSICLEPHVKSLHLTLAYQFPSSVYKPLKELAESLVPFEKSVWELRLYSRDPRLATHHVHKVKHEYSSVENDELELRLGDYIYIEESALKNSADGWVQGISWLTGISGYLPAVYTERTAESDAWTLHRSTPLGHQNLTIDKSLSKTASSNESLSRVNVTDSNNVDVNTTEVPKLSEKEQWAQINNKMSSELSKLLTRVTLDTDNDSGSATVSNDMSSTDGNNTEETSVRNLYVMRHGERVDFTYGSWVPYCFDEHDNYIRKDMNMPPSLPKRSGGSASYTSDCPLTMVGLLQARSVGEGMKASGVTLSRVYCSPSYRCVQTTHAVLEGLEVASTVKICIEPSLFEWLVWYPKGPPLWMTPQELHAANFNIDLEYEPMMKVGEPPFVEISEDHDCLENCSQFYERNGKFVSKILKDTEKSGSAPILMVGHAITLDTAWRGLSGLGVRESMNLGEVMRGVAYCSLVALRGPPWELVPPPCLPFMNTANKRFDWKILK